MPRGKGEGKVVFLFCVEKGGVGSTPPLSCLMVCGEGWVSFIDESGATRKVLERRIDTLPEYIEKRGLKRTNDALIRNQDRTI